MFIEVCLILPFRGASKNPKTPNEKEEGFVDWWHRAVFNVPRPPTVDCL